MIHALSGVAYRAPLRSMHSRTACPGGDWVASPCPATTRKAADPATAAITQRIDIAARYRVSWANATRGVARCGRACGWGCERPPRLVVGGRHRRDRNEWVCLECLGQGSSGGDVGVDAHSDAQVDRVADSGAGWVGLSSSWAVLEPTNGVYSTLGVG